MSNSAPYVQHTTAASAPSSAQTPLEVARGYHRRGWPPVPVPPRSKNPGFDGWQNLLIPYDALPRYFRDNGEVQNIGVLLGDPAGGLQDVDLDTAEARALADYLLPHTEAVFGRASNPRSHRLYLPTAGVPRTRKWELVRSGRDKVMIVEIRSTGGQTIFPGSVHESGEPIHWDSAGEPARVSVAELHAAVGKIAAGALLVPYWRRGARNDLSLALSGALLRAGWADTDAAAFIGAIAAVAGDAEEASRRRNVQQTRRKLDDGRGVWGLPKLSDLIGDAITVQHVAKWLELGRMHGGANGRQPPVRADGAEHAEADAPQLTDLGNAERLVAQFGQDLHYCYAWGKWLVWDDQRWRIDEQGMITRCAKDTVRALLAEAAAQPDEERQKALTRHALRSQAEARIKAMIELAKSEPGIPVTPDQFDRDPWLLNVQNGTLDLRTGQLRAHSREDLITKLVPVAYDERAGCPTFERFLDDVFASHESLIRFIQRAVGYSLTGDTRGGLADSLWHRRQWQDDADESPA
jgi:hypothetical protein